ncbi:hypothetical protein OQA88_5300 [Cercophora sp. LCS_1]
MATADCLLPMEPSMTTYNDESPPIAMPTAPPLEPFDASKDLCFSPPSKTYTMTDISLPADIGVSPLAVSEPFPLFTPAAVKRMRDEVLSPAVFNNCQYSSNIAMCQLRGYADKYTPFIYDAWKSPVLLKHISLVAGIDLTLQFDLEIGHINLSYTPDQEGKEVTPTDADADIPIVGWHRDSYPFVCVVMLSDATNMVGGETALRTGTGEILKIKSPQMGHALVLQGRYIEHQALRALGTTERITMVTSFRPRSAKIRDDSVLRTVRPISDLGELYYQYMKYRLEMLEDRIREQLREFVADKGGGRKIPTSKIKAFLEEQEDFIRRTNGEIVPDDQVVVGELH